MLPRWLLQFKTAIKKINLFEDIRKTNEEDIKNQKISTIIFLILFTLSVVGLFLYASLTPITKTVTIQQPSLSDYKQLEQKHPNALVCPCTNVSNEYNKFISSLTPTFTQLCRSDFVSDSWLNYVNYRSLVDRDYHYVWDFRHSAYAFFAMLRTLCMLASQTIHDRLITFYSTILLTNNAISEDTFLNNINAARDQYVNTSTANFMITLNSVLLIGQFDDMLINRLLTNRILYVISTHDKTLSWDTWNDYSYSTQGICPYPAGIYWCAPTGIYFRKLPNETQSNISWVNYRAELQFEVPGIFVGNFLLYSTLQSNISCFYNKTCLSELNKYLNDSLYPFNGTTLSVPSSSFSYLPTISDLAKQLMVDAWQLNSSYQDYFSACHPSTCTYTYVYQFDAIFIVTTVISFIGGIITLLMFLTLPIVTLLRKLFQSFKKHQVTTTTVVESQPRISLLVKIRNFLFNFNFFEDLDKQSEWDLRNQRLSTRLFIVAMIISLSILILYTSVSSVTQTLTINEPSIDIYVNLQNKYPKTLVCPCSSIANEHHQFISFQPTFHPVCQSDFITENWADYLSVKDYFHVSWDDFRYTNSKFFQTIASFCQLSLETIDNQLLVFNSTKYITKYVQSTDLFYSEIQQLINDMTQTTINSFKLLLSMLRQTIWGNGLYTMVSYRYALDPTVPYERNLSIDDGDIHLIFYPNNYVYNQTTNCSCKTHSTTCQKISSITGFVNGAWDTNLYGVLGYYTGCYASETLFQSSLECFFNETCLQIIYDLIQSNSKYPFNATPMYLNSTRYDMTTSLQDIIDNLLVEDWNDQISFESYFKQCNPSFCTYSYDLRGDFSYVFAITISLIGGLTTILKLIIPFIVKTIRKCQLKRRTNVVHPQQPQVTLIQKMKITILTLNLFKNRNKRSAEQLRRQRILTRIFLISIFVTLVILVFYVSLNNLTTTISKENPTLNEFNEFNKEYSNTAQCSCKTYSIKYQEFISFEPRLHSICSSQFINWFEIDYPLTMADSYGIPTYSTRKDDFRQIASSFFQLLNSFCRISSQTINAELKTFYSNRFITLNLITFEQFQIQIDHLINQFLINTARSFINSLYVTENMTAANMLFSAFSTDSMFSSAYPAIPYEYYGEYSDADYIYDRKDQIYNDCDCQQTSWCVQQAIVYDLDTVTPLFSPPGIFVGCYMVAAVLQSDLRCFFDIDCLQQLVDSLSLSNINVSDVVLSLAASQYQINSSLLEIFSNIMIEQWNNETSYDNYFNICKPSVCTVTYVNRGNIIYIITTTIGLIGGLTKTHKIFELLK